MIGDHKPSIARIRLDFWHLFTSSSDILRLQLRLWRGWTNCLRLMRKLAVKR
jgi:hypothetical protein